MTSITNLRSFKSRRSLCNELRVGRFLLPLYLLLGALLTFSITHAQEKSSQPLILPIQDLQVFTEAFNIIRKNYVEEVSDSELFENAIHGMLSQLDPHSQLLDQDELNELVDTTRGNFFGVGIEMQKADELLVIVNVIADSPASNAGLIAGDTILAINNEPTDQLSLSQAAQLVKGDENTKLQLTVLSTGSDDAKTVKLKRQKIDVPNVSSRLLEPQYAYIKIHSFQENTAIKLQQILMQYQNKPLQGIIIDLRNNPGGLLTSAIDVADLFLYRGLIVYTQGRGINTRQEYLATETEYSNNAVLAVLVNQNSASAAEIVAGALQDHNRAIVVGSTTFGKGSVQTIIPITDKRAIKLTTSLYYTPSGRTINIKGIKPDIVIRNRPLDDTTGLPINALVDTQLSAALNALKGTILQREKAATPFLEKVE